MIDHQEYESYRTPDDFLWFLCHKCDEEYELPEETTRCPICGSGVDLEIL